MPCVQTLCQSSCHSFHSTQEWSVWAETVPGFPKERQLNALFRCRIRAVRADFSDAGRQICYLHKKIIHAITNLTSAVGVRPIIQYLIFISIKKNSYKCNKFDNKSNILEVGEIGGPSHPLASYISWSLCNGLDLCSHPTCSFGCCIQSSGVLLLLLNPS